MRITILFQTIGILCSVAFKVPYDQVDVNVHPNKSEVRFQNKRLIYEIVRRWIIKTLSTRFAACYQGIEEELIFNDSKSQEQVDSHEKKDQKEFYEKEAKSFRKSFNERIQCTR